MNSKTTIVGVFPDSDAARDALSNVRRHGFLHSTLITAKSNHRFEGGRERSLVAAAAAGCIALAIVVGYGLGVIAATSFMLHVAPYLAGVVTAALLAVVALAFMVSQFGVGRTKRARLRKWIISGESIVIVEADIAHVKSAIDLIGEEQRDRPITFTFHPRSFTSATDNWVSLRSEPPSMEKLSDQARALAEHHVAGKRHGNVHQLNERLDESDRTFSAVLSHISATAGTETGVDLSSEWLLDNAHLIRRHFAEYRSSLSGGFYRQLPILDAGAEAGLPRVYAVARTLVADTDAQFDRSKIIAFLAAYQTARPLTLGELWAMPLMLRLAVLEHLKRLILNLDQRQREHQEAAFLANRLLSATRTHPEAMLTYVAQLTRDIPNPSPHLVEQLLGHLYDETAVVAAVRSWVESALGGSITDITENEQHAQALQQVSLANAIGSLRDLSRMDWSTVVEETSVADLVLRTDPADVYAHMDFGTRDQYRHVIERIARHSKYTEIDVAWAALEEARNSPDRLRQHVGYHLVDNGLPRLEKRLGYHPPIGESVRRFIYARPGRFYIGAVLLMTLGILAAVVHRASTHSDAAWLTIALALTALLLSSEVAVTIVNALVTAILPPRSLPRLDLSKAIPDEQRTLIVVPMMLLTPESIRHEVERINIHWLANQDKNLLFALLADYSDAPEKHMPEDLERLEVAQRGIDALIEQHGDDRFYLLHREREWCTSENCWMGWERKRGKIEDLNRLIVNDPAPGRPTVYVHGNAERLAGIRYVITLDADTELPQGTAARLIGTIAHPLNAPQISPKNRLVTHGYTIIQPRVTTSLPSATSTLFTRLFTDPRGTDPYTHVSADLYQDLSGEASYYGKGIYDVAAFHAVLTGRFPDSHLLSHDLIESTFVRAGLASDVELFDNFPADYISFSGRQHRWIRGDWQIADWLFPITPTHGGHERNALSALSRWKIFDNLRRSLIPLVGFLGLVLAWLASGHPLWWTLFIAVTLTLPDLVGVIRGFGAMILRAPGASAGFIGGATRGLFTFALLPHQAFLAADAIGRTLHRRLVTHLHLLEWETASEAHRKSKNRQSQFVISMLWIPALSIAIGIACGKNSVDALVSALPFLLLWSISPAIVASLWSPSVSPRQGQLSDSDKLFLRRLARRTWRFFDDFVNADTNWLPPDNRQTSLRVETAPRTSLTNLGLWLLSAQSAWDLGYASVDSLVERLEKTFDTMDRLERPGGHLLNWYATHDLTPLAPRYISSVDSGNLLGALWAFVPGVTSFGTDAVLNKRLFDGLADTAAVLREFETGTTQHLADNHYTTIEALCRDGGERLDGLVGRIRDLRIASEKLLAAAESTYAQKPAISYWASKFHEQTMEANTLVDRYLSWVEILEEVPTEGLLSLGSSAHSWRRSALAAVPSLAAISQSSVPGLASLVGLASHVGSSTAPLISDWLTRLSSSVDKSRRNAIEEMDRINRLANRARQTAASIDMRFLYDESKRVFSIGYNTDDHRLDNSYYDLLASESRLGSLVSIASGAIPAKHWSALGRPFGNSYGKPAMMSWSGTMFEYLMPLLLTKCFENSLLDLACRTAVESQMEYGRSRGVPWGISESGYSALDSRQIYQYYAFGVPSLALKRDVETLLVVAPYASVLALMVEPAAAVANLRRLKRGGVLRSNEEQSMMGECGFYEAIDYSRRSNQIGQRGVIVRSYMAHHQGMSLVALNNTLNDDIMRTRFHSDPRIRAVESLLYEGVHLSGTLPEVSRPLEIVHSKRISVDPPSVARITTPNTLSPRVCLLSNSSYNVMVTNAGGGYSRWKDIEITRWRADATRDSYGTYCYIKDVETGTFWSTTHQPVKREVSEFSVLFALEKAEIKCRYQGIESITDIAVSPEDDVEVRRITLVNHSSRARTLELTTYAELSLASHDADRAHPAFGKLFVETEYLPAYGALAAHRRPRSNSETNPWVFHMLTSPARGTSYIEYETSRADFIGRGRDLGNPLAMDGPLMESVGAVLDPVFSIRRRVTIKPGERVQIVSVLGVAQDKETIERLAMKYSTREAAHRALELAWTNAQLELRHLRIQSRDALHYQRLAAYVVYPGAALRPATERLGQSMGGQDRLWAHGISGDLPLVVITIGDDEDLDVVRELLLAHSYWRVKSLVCDLLILNDEPGGYNQPLAERLRQLVNVHSQTVGAEQPGGVFIRPLRQMGVADAALLQATARIALVAARGSLSQQMGLVPTSRHVVSNPTRPHILPESPSAPLPFLDLDYHNGRGGFTKDGKEYAIYLGAGETTPAPWINVIANPSFGATVSETGAGMTWAHNSQSNRLTPWSNDPVTDPASDALYLRDEEVGVVWTPTASPIRENDPYRARHGSGYSIFEHSSHGIMQELTVYVPVEDQSAPTVRVQILRLRNDSDRRRRLTLTSYAEWVLGTDRDATQSHVQTLFDRQSQSIFARNPYHPNYPHNVAFMAINRVAASYTGDRAEFIGRNGTLAHPEAMMRDRLSGTTGTGLDPCGAIQVDISIEPGREETVVILLGEAKSVDDARALITRYRDHNEAAKALRETQAWWEHTLSAVTVETPVQSVDLLLNRWTLYQAICCRIWGRSAFYQSGGAYGFRDQLQDVMAVLISRPEIARAQILRSAARQFREGDVQHWWHVETGAGTRTRISDDLLWLPFVTAQYIRVTGDAGILDEPVKWLEAPVLTPEEHEVYTTPTVTEDASQLLEHCIRAVTKGSTSGQHGLPLIGGGDWNDGLNRVGAGGKGESVWLAWFLIHVFHDLAELLRMRGFSNDATAYDNKAKELAAVIEDVAWDGDWYLRAFFDDGSPLGSAGSDEARIDSLPQSWAVISGLADPARAQKAMAAVESNLVREHEQIVLLFTPPFDKTERDPGYIKGYVPGVRENGGQYTHGALWSPLAFARLGDGDRAANLLLLMSPIEHSNTPEKAARYAVEPYAVAADVYALQGREGRGGWTWYTGSASWMYRVWVEEVLGLTLRGDNLTVTPVIPASWPGFKMKLRHGDATYTITVTNHSGSGSKAITTTLDGKPVNGGAVPVSREAGQHQVDVVIGEPPASVDIDLAGLGIPPSVHELASPATPSR
ncbi:MAG TPA: glucoamylase family protein [Capsulimonadaceae bacterium]|jgi:cyclic beta-1,2-glucan synthetase